jgi:hypothetical protein
MLAFPDEEEHDRYDNEEVEEPRKNCEVRCRRDKTRGYDTVTKGDNEEGENCSVVIIPSNHFILRENVSAIHAIAIAPTAVTERMPTVVASI